jgi:hypothetical protein
MIYLRHYGRRIDSLRDFAQLQELDRVLVYRE